MIDFASPHVLTIGVVFNLAGIVKGVTGVGLPTVAISVIQVIAEERSINPS
jgi:hypothetical protein